MSVGFLKAWRMRAAREEIYSRPDYWNEKAKVYSGSAVSMFPNRALNELVQHDQFAFFRDGLGQIGGQRILDACCGTGRLSRYLAERGASVTAFDFSPDAVSIARRESAGLDVEYSVQSVFEFAPRARFDAVTVLAALTVACKNPRDFQAAIGRLRNCLVPGGRLVLLEPFHSNFLHRVLKLNRREARQLIADAGFDVFMMRNIHFWPTRFLLSVGDFPSIVTTPIHHAGELLLRIPPFRHSGDYTCIAAIRSND